MNSLTNICGSGDEAKPETGRELQPFDQHGLNHVKHRHCINLVAPNHMDHHEHIGRSDEPRGFL